MVEVAFPLALKHRVYEVLKPYRKGAYYGNETYTFVEPAKYKWTIALIPTILLEDIKLVMSQQFPGEDISVTIVPPEEPLSFDPDPDRKHDESRNEDG